MQDGDELLLRVFRGNPEEACTFFPSYSWGFIALSTILAAALHTGLQFLQGRGGVLVSARRLIRLRYVG